MNVTRLCWWLVNIGAIRQQTINWHNFDRYLCGHIVSLDHNELIAMALTTSCLQSLVFSWCQQNIFKLSDYTFQIRSVIFKLILVIDVGYILYIYIYEWHWKLLMVSQHRFRQWPGTVKQQAITWAKVDPKSMSPYGVARPQRVESKGIYAF